MSTQKHCPGCFQDKAWLSECPHCGYDESATRPGIYLPHGALIGGQFRIGRVLGKRGGFGITYLGWDVHLQQRVAIKEYLPRELAGRRDHGLDILLHSPDDAAAFDAGREQFLREARIVASLDHPNIVRVRSFFRANGTAYLVMDYYPGISLGEYLATIRPRLPAEVAVRLLRPVLDGLHYVHERGVVHRDLKPHNVYLASVGRPIVLDFGAARHAAPGRDDSHSVVVSEGYAPLEQYQRHAAQGPWTDVYAAAGTLYRVITGRQPPIALDRIGNDLLERDHWEGLPDGLKPVIATAMALRGEDRFSSARDFRIALDDSWPGWARDDVDLDLAFDAIAPGEAATLAAASPPHPTSAPYAPLWEDSEADTEPRDPVPEESEPPAASATQPTTDDGPVLQPAPQSLFERWAPTAMIIAIIVCFLLLVFW